MGEILKPTNRRAILRQGFAFLAGAFGFAVIDKRDKQALRPEPAASVAGSGETLRLYGRRWQVSTQVRQAGEASGSGYRLIGHGELFARPEGERCGEFYSTRFCLGSLFGPNPLANSNLEIQTFRLRDGMLFGMTTGGSDLEGEQAHAVLGGTGRYAGARGSYVVSRNPESGRPGMIEIVLNFAT